MGCVYEHRASVTTVSGTIATTTLKTRGGKLDNVYISANTNTTLFKFELADDSGIVRLRYDYHRGEINDVDVGFPIVGEYTGTITNASPNDTFQIILGVSEY